jgi:stage V sporulation protein K
MADKIGGLTTAGRRESLQQIIAEMEKMVGMVEVKTELNRFISLARLMVVRRERDLPAQRVNLHMVFSGPPGTGKTVVARKVGRMLKAIRLLKNGDCIEVDRSNLVAPYVGQTATKTREVVESALDSVLFIDEAYTLTNQGGQSDPFGQEAVDTLLRLMENYRERLVVIAAGYTDQMRKFVDSNPGLRSRFARFVEFKPYNRDELMAIFTGMVTDAQMTLDAPAQKAALDAIRELASHGAMDESFGNARVIRSFFEKIVTAQAERLSQTDDLEQIDLENLQAVSKDDVAAAAEAM